MKRTLLLLILVVCAASAFAVPHYLRAREAAKRQEAYVRMLASRPLVLDAKTEAILNNADRVETFLLQGSDEDEDASGKLAAAYASPHYLEDRLVVSTGPTQGRAFAGLLRAALVQGTSEPDIAQCFMPGVGFRVWKGQAHTDISVCFTCQGIEIVTKDAKQTVLHQSLTELGASRPALLALSKQAFPQDKQLAAVE